MALSDTGHIAILPGPNGQDRPCPELLTEDEAIRFLRLDVDGPSDPARTLRHYREKGLLKATQVGKRLRYQHKELLKFLDLLTEKRSAPAG